MCDGSGTESSGMFDRAIDGPPLTQLEAEDFDDNRRWNTALSEVVYPESFASREKIREERNRLLLPSRLSNPKIVRVNCSDEGVPISKAIEYFLLHG